MKFIYFITFLLFIYICSSFLPNSFIDKTLFWFDNNDKYLSKEERLVNKILYQTSTSVGKKYNIATSGTLISMPGGDIRKMGLAFSSYLRLSRDQLRKLIIQIAEELLHNINSNSEIQHALTKRPFTIENVDIIIYNYDDQANWIYDPEIGLARLFNGVIFYKTKDPAYEYVYKNEYEETYQEALDKLQNLSQK